jgi:hydroxypyruvate isomerase
MLFLDQPIQDRARRLHDLGFQVEIWDWTRHDLAALARTGAVFGSMTGYIRGNLTDEDGAAELLRTAGE